VRRLPRFPPFVQRGYGSITEVTWFLLDDSSTLRFQTDPKAPVRQGLKGGAINAGLTPIKYSPAGPSGHLT
jgi:hypothetical protein